MPGDAYMAWWAYFDEYAKWNKARTDKADHDNLMDQASKAVNRQH